VLKQNYFARQLTYLLTYVVDAVTLQSALCRLGPIWYRHSCGSRESGDHDIQRQSQEARWIVPSNRKIRRM